MHFTPQTGHTNSAQGQGYVIQSGRTRKPAQVAAIQAKRRNQGQMSPRTRQEALPPATNYAKKPAGSRSVLSPTEHKSMLKSMFQDGVHMKPIPARVRLKKGQAIA